MGLVKFERAVQIPARDTEAVRLRQLAAEASEIVENAKLLATNSAARWLWLRALVYVTSHPVQGVVPRVVVEQWKGLRQAEHLVTADLWREVPGGWRYRSLAGAVPERQTSTVTAPTSSPAFLTFAVMGGGTWALTDAQVATWAATYPAIDVKAECLKAHAWVTASGRYKTAKGMPRFLLAWLNRCNDRVRPAGMTAPAGRGRTGAAPAGKYAQVARD